MNRTTLLFIHGFVTGPWIWQGQVGEFSRDYQVVTDMAQIDHATDVFIIGWSMGAFKALDLWQEHHQKIKGLVLVSAFPKYVKSADYPCGTPLALLKKLEKRFLADYQDGLAYFYELIFKDNKYLKLAKTLPVPVKHDLIRWFERLEHDDKRDILPKINVPVLLVQGGRDPIVSPAAADYMRDNIKQAQLHVFSGAGHAPFLEEPRRFNKLMKDFIVNCEKQ